MFGSHLNKMKSSEKVGGSGTEGKECATKTGPTWKLRKWTKGGGYTTVRGGGEGRGGDSQHRRDEEDGEGVCNASEEGSSSGKECVTSSSTDNKKIRVKYCTANKLILYTFVVICMYIYMYM